MTSRRKRRSERMADAAKAAPLKLPIPICWDCRDRVGIHSAIQFANGSIGSICSLCMNKWRPYMHRTDSPIHSPNIEEMSQAF
jgi:hypothetical protein